MSEFGATRKPVLVLLIGLVLSLGCGVGAQSLLMNQALSISGVGFLKSVDDLTDPEWTASNTQVVPLSDMFHYPEWGGQIGQRLQEFRCRQVIIKEFQQGTHIARLRVYCFDDSLGAWAAYLSMRMGASTVLVLGEASSEDDKSISFCQGNYFVTLSSEIADDDVTKKLLSQLAGKLSASIGVHAAKPTLLQGLPPVDRIEGSEKIVMGPYYADQVFLGPYLGMLSWDKLKLAVCADYKYAAPMKERMRLFWMQYESPAVAIYAYNRYVGNLQSVHKTTENNNSCLVKLSNGYLLCQIQRDRVAIITGAHNRLGCMTLARQLTY
jgi:hypothetical protein